MESQAPILSRTSCAERYVEELLSIPLVSEFVCRSPQRLDRTQREVADFLLLWRDQGILISQKCQEDPASREADRTEEWARKNAAHAAAQLGGALRSARIGPVWAEHPRRGRIEFPSGLPPVVHGVVLVEVFQPVNLEPEVARLPLQYQDTPISYLSVNDFLNIAMELRTVPELLTYLDARRSLPLPELRTIGDE